MAWFLQKESNFTWNDIMSFTPMEFDIFYYMGVNDFKEREEARQKAARQS